MFYTNDYNVKTALTPYFPVERISEVGREWKRLIIFDDTPLVRFGNGTFPEDFFACLPHWSCTVLPLLSDLDDIHTEQCLPIRYGEVACNVQDPHHHFYLQHA